MPERDEPDVMLADAAAHGDRTAAALAPLRERIDAIDHEIVALLNERAQIALEIGRVKEQTGRRTVRDAKRETEVLERVTSASAGLFPEPELVALYRKLIAATRRVQHAQKRQAAEAAAGAGPAAVAEPATKASRSGRGTSPDPR
jgi:chorismate mutase/prephenate dehydratase